MSSSNDKTIITDNANLSMLQPQSRTRACFVQYSGASLGKRYLLEKPEVTIGRAPTTGIVIAEASVSREHLKCYLIAGKVEIEDLGSSNGTFVNDQKVEVRTGLHDGDIIRIGSVLLKYFAHDNIENVFHDKIYRMATIDAGTQIFNRKYVLESLESEFRFSRAYDRNLSLVMYDLDFFKKVNDVHGHNAGDFILKESAAIAKNCIRKEDVFGRFGGEEFCLILPNTDLKTAADSAERIRDAIAKHTFQFEEKTLQQTISMGVAQMSADHTGYKDLIEEADKKLYKSKSDGRNRVTF